MKMLSTPLQISCKQKWTFPAVGHLKWKLEFVSNLLWMIAGWYRKFRCLQSWNNTNHVICQDKFLVFLASSESLVLTLNYFLRSISKLLNVCLVCKTCMSFKLMEPKKFKMKSVQNLRWLVKVFSISAWTENLVMTLVLFVSFVWSVNLHFPKIKRNLRSNHIKRYFRFLYWEKVGLEPLATLLISSFRSVNYANLVYKLNITFWKCQDAQKLCVLESI